MNESTIAALEQRYRALLRDFQAGQLDEAALISAADDLYFQDGGGRCWAIGLQTGAWYYHDGQTWRPADPRQSDQLPVIGAPKQPGVVEPKPGRAGERPTVPSQKPPTREGKQPRPTSASSSNGVAGLLVIPARSLLMASAVFIVILALLALPAGGAPPDNSPPFAPSPRPPLGGGSTGGGGEGGGGGGSRGAIVGTIMDLSTGKPGASVKVSVSGYPPVRTDKDGRYSVSDLPAGEYTVSLELDGQGALSGGPVLVNVDGQHSATVDMTYRSQPQPLPTDTPQPAAVAEPPPSLPKSGAPAGPWPLVVAGLGLLLTLAGGMLRFGDRQP